MHTTSLKRKDKKKVHFGCVSALGPQQEDIESPQVPAQQRGWCTWLCSLLNEAEVPAAGLQSAQQLTGARCLNYRETLEKAKG